jgi:hypothetical protein
LKPEESDLWIDAIKKYITVDAADAEPVKLDETVQGR